MGIWDRWPPVQARYIPKSCTIPDQGHVLKLTPEPFAEAAIFRIAPSHHGPVLQGTTRHASELRDVGFSNKATQVVTINIKRHPYPSKAVAHSAFRMAAKAEAVL